MIVWGGFDASVSPLRSGGRFNPATADWLPTPTRGGCPEARTSHTAVWTGTEMIVWGGKDGFLHSSHYLDSGGRYDPVNDEWRPTARNGAAPGPRVDHVAVWTGTEMIVWGGVDGISWLNGGGRYAPTSDSWTAMTTTGAPAGRRLATAVWTGSEMIVWGGVVQSIGRVNSGGRYSPSSNTWQPTSQGTGVPDGREQHTAVWSGNEMIVWGGYAGTGAADTGGRYDPAGDSWAATSLPGSPAARSSHSAVWTGTEMIIWGGDVAPGMTNGGGRYNPTNDSWLATSTGAYVPSPRVYFSAVWTGSEMIVWGGYEGGSGHVVDTGSRYCADSCASPATLYRDTDGDGYGNAGDSQVTCASPPGWVALAGDCDDTRPDAHPGAPEVCNGLDEDCDAAIDEGFTAPSGSPSLTESRSGTSAVVTWTSVSGRDGSTTSSLGDLALLHASMGDFTSSTTGCLGNDFAGLSAVDWGVSPPGGGSWHLVRAVSFCGGNGSYDDGHQQGSRDAEIAASGRACP